MQLEIVRQGIGQLLAHFTPIRLQSRFGSYVKQQHREGWAVMRAFVKASSIYRTPRSTWILGIGSTSSTRWHWALLWPNILPTNPVCTTQIEPSAESTSIASTPVLDIGRGVVHTAPASDHLIYEFLTGKHLALSNATFQIQSIGRSVRTRQSKAFPSFPKAFPKPPSSFSKQENGLFCVPCFVCKKCESGHL